MEARDRLEAMSDEDLRAWVDEAYADDTERYAKLRAAQEEFNKWRSSEQYQRALNAARELRRRKLQEEELSNGI